MGIFVMSWLTAAFLVAVAATALIASGSDKAIYPPVKFLALLMGTVALCLIVGWLDALGQF
jgi:hypothetical protein